jgi:exodeoxyribonuclease VII large subunit
VITSPTGAAIRDFLEVLRQRWRGVDVLVMPVKVQGEGAAADIVRAIELANRLAPPLDVLVVTRGGGSIEDLWCFNEEPVVRAIHASEIPVVSAIGHEIDVTLTDLVADVRALTPTEAAQRVVPAAEEVRAGLQHIRARLSAALAARAATARLRLAALADRRVLSRPLERIRDLERRLDELQERASHAVRQVLRGAGQQVAGRASQLASLSPLAVLARGYTVTHRVPDGTLVDRADMLQVGQQIRTRYAAGETLSRVELLMPGEPGRPSPPAH